MSKTILNKYQLGDCIGKGGFGAVFKALDMETGLFVAVKRIPIKKLPKEEVTSLKAEISLLRKLNHPHITKYIDHQVTKEELFIIMEYVENGSLQSVVKKFGKFPEPLVGLYVSQVLIGLAYLHDEGVIHRDIKGANILTTKDGIIKLADFGVAAKLSEIEAESVVGTPYWMAPEIIELNPPQYASDIWSVGCTVIELLEGNPPFFELAPMAALFHIVQDEHPPLPQAISPALKDFLLQCFQKDPGLRASAKSLLKHKWIQASKRRSAKTNIDEDYATIKMHNERGGPERISIDELFANKDTPTAAHGRERKSGRLSPTGTLSDLSTDKLDKRISSSKLAKYMEEPVNDEDVDLDWGDDEPAALPASKTVRTEPGASGTRSSGKPEVAPAPAAAAEPKSASALNKSGLKLPPLQHPKGPVGSVDTEKRRRKVSISEPIDKVVDSKTMVGKKSTAEPENVEDDFLVEEDDSVDLQSKLKRLKMKTIAPSDVRDGFLPSNGGGQLAKYTEFGDDADFEADDGFAGEPLDLSSRLKSLSVGDDHTEKDVFDDEESEIDPFATIASGDDGGMGASYEQLSDVIKKQVQNLDNPDLVLSSCNLMLHIFEAHPEQKHQLTAHHGIMPILELLENYSNNPLVENPSVKEQDCIIALLRVLNSVIRDDVRYLENLCLMGALPTILKFSFSGWDTEVRDQAGRFVHDICHSSTLTLQMFIACRGLPILTQFMEYGKEDYQKVRPLFLIAVDCVIQVFHVQSRTPRNDFARVFVRSMLANRIADVLMKIVEETGTDQEERERYVDEISTILLIFSQGDHFVKVALADEGVLRNVYSSLDRLPQASQTKMLKCIRNISSDAMTLDMLQRTGFIAKLVKYLHLSLIPDQNASHVVPPHHHHPHVSSDDASVLSVSSSTSSSSVPTPPPPPPPPAAAAAAAAATVSTALKKSDKKETEVKKMARKSKSEIPHEATPTQKDTKTEKETKRKTIGPSVFPPPTREDSTASLTGASRASDVQNQVLMALYNLCRINKIRQEIAAEAGIIPCLMQLIMANSPLNQFALPMLCDLAHASKKCLAELARNDGVAFYLRILTRQSNWQANALEAIAAWITTDSVERKRVEQVLLVHDNLQKLVQGFATKDNRAFAALVQPMSKIVQSSTVLAEALSTTPEFVAVTVRQLQNPALDDAQVRLRLLSLVEHLYTASKNPKRFIIEYRLFALVRSIMEGDKKVMVKEQAKNLLEAFESNQVL
eukprot:ANDGO_05391.mRNA.1 MAP3K epsilon protein kinase 1